MTDLPLLSLPAANDDWSGWLADRVDTLLSDAQSRLTALKDGTRRSADEVLEFWNESDIALHNAAAVCSVLSEVHPDETVRTLAERRAQDVDRLRTERGLDRELFEVLEATDPSDPDDQAARFREHVLRDFRRAGVDQSDDARDRLRAISERLTVLDQDFSRIIRDDVRSIRIEPHRLAGLPEDYIAAHPPGDDGLVTITTDYPDLLPFRAFAHDAEARTELIVEYLNRGWPDNDAVLHEMLSLRDEKARMLGYHSWPDYDADVRMIGTAQAVAEFIERIADAAGPAGERDRAMLVERQRRDDPAAERFDYSHVAYYSELVRREQFDVDAQEVRRYFNFPDVRAGLLDVTSRLFGIEYTPADVPTWHPDVVAYDVHSEAGALLGRIYLDLHPREGKFKHAAQFDLLAGIEGRQLPEGALVCNFPTGLMEHQHVVTLFHEFGHLVHHVLGGRQRFDRFSGVATEWDFVEAPSQMLEEWAWDADILQTFAVADGEPIPAELVARMRAGKDFGKGLFVRMQISFAAIAYLLHRDLPADHDEAVRALQARYDVLDNIPGTHFQAAFGHLSGYTSAYYTYMWSLVIAKDLFSAFDPGNLFDPTVAHRYRDRILVPGGSKDAADLVADFLGRPFNFEAFAAWLDREAVPTTR